MTLSYHIGHRMRASVSSPLLQYDLWHLCQSPLWIIDLRYLKLFLLGMTWIWTLTSLNASRDVTPNLIPMYYVSLVWSILTLGFVSKSPVLSLTLLCVLWINTMLSVNNIHHGTSSWLCSVLSSPRQIRTGWELILGATLSWLRSVSCLLLLSSLKLGSMYMLLIALIYVISTLINFKHLYKTSFVTLSYVISWLMYTIYCSLEFDFSKTFS